MKIDSLVLGAFQTNCYILRQNESTKDCLIIDTGLEARRLLDFLKTNNLNPLAIVLTHGHADHITGVTALRENFPDIKVYVHKLDASMFEDTKSNLSEFAPIPLNIDPPDCLLEEGDVIESAGIKLEVFHTPGHTPGGICLYSKENRIVFAGDTLFADSVGRTDFPGGDMVQLINAIKQKLLTLPDETIVCTGHGPATTIAREKAANPYLQ